MSFSRRQFLQSSAFATATLPTLFAHAEQISTTVQKRQKEVSWLDEIQSPPKSLPDDSPALRSLRVDGSGKEINTLDQWQARRKAIRAWWLEFLNPLGTRSEDRPPKLKVLAEDRDAGVIRQRVSYEVEPGISTEAYLLKPIGKKKNLPAVAVFHSTVNHSIHQPAGVQGKPEKAFGLKLAQRGYVTFCPRNFLWPTNDKIEAGTETKRFHERLPKCKGMAKMLHDSLVAIDILCAQPEVDTKRIGSIGHSLGAKEVLYLAAIDERVQVTVSSEGGIGTRFSNWDAPWYLGPTIKDAGFDREHHEVLSLVAPRPFLLIGGDSADGARSWPFIERGLEVYKLYKGTPRVGLFNHGKGHSVPPEAEKRIYAWFAAYL